MMRKCLIYWRKGSDSNRRYAKDVHWISSPAHSTTLPPFLLRSLCGVDAAAKQKIITEPNAIRNLVGRHLVGRRFCRSNGLAIRSRGCELADCERPFLAEAVHSPRPHLIDS